MSRTIFRTPSGLDGFDISSFSADLSFEAGTWPEFKSSVGLPSRQERGRGGALEARRQSGFKPDVELMLDACFAEKISIFLQILERGPVVPDNFGIILDTSSLGRYRNDDQA